MSWLIPRLSGWSTAPPDTKVVQHDEKDTLEDDDLDKPPQFPLPDSVQRSQAPPIPSTATPTPPPPSFSIAPPSPSSSPQFDAPSDLNIAVLPDPIPIGDMAPPPSTIARPTFGIQSGGSDETVTSTPKLESKAKKQGKVALGPGYSPLDWARLTGSGANLRGFVGPMLRVNAEELKRHATEKDAWTVLNGRVYNITPYLPFHPGGVDELMRVAGRDGTKLFMLTHSWVNIDHMLQECLVGMFVR